MKNITLAIDETLLEQARELAGRRHTSLNAMVRSLMAEAVQEDGRIAAAKQELKRLMDEAPGTLGTDYTWNREEIYAEREDRLLSRLEHPAVRRGGEEG